MNDKAMFSTSELAAIEKTWTSDEHFKVIKNNWSTFRELINKIDGRKDKINVMLDHYEERVSIAPASTKINYHNAFPGGFIDHSLRVMSTTIKIASALDTKIKFDSLIISSLFHDWGKAGTVDNDYYISNNSQWHRERGMLYVVNEKIKLSTAQLCLFTFMKFGIELTEDEYMAILLNDGQYVEENKRYSMKEPKLALIVHMADRWATQCEKNRKSLLQPATPEF